MLFDLSSPRRKNVVRVVYGALALLFAGGFIFFGIGSESGAGGLFDGLFGEGGGGSTADQFEQQVEDAEEQLDSNPDDQRALQQLAYYRAQSGIAQLEVDETTGQPTGVTEDARSELEAAIDAWGRYLDTDPRNVDAATAGQILLSYQFLNDFEGAADVQETLAKEDPSFVNYTRLAFLRYNDLDLKRGDAALDKARAEADKGNQVQIKQLEDLREQVVKFRKKQAKQPDSEEGAAPGLESPFGGLSPDAGVPPTTP
jgi:hypothetical protein